MRGDIRKDNRGLALNWIMGIFAMSVGLLFVILGLVFILPDLSRDPDGAFVLWMCEGLGGVVMLVGAYQIFVEIKRSNKKKRLKEIGRQFKMPITRIVVDNTTRLNDMPGYKIVCTSPVFLEGAMQQYTSHIVYEDLYNKMAEGDIVTVYVDPADVQNYYVDLDEVECAPSTTYNDKTYSD